MTPRSGPGGAGSDPRGPKTTPRAPQERPKSRPEAVSEQPWWPPGADLAPKRPPGSPFGPLGGGFWPLRGSQSSPAQATVTSPPPSQKPMWGRRHEPPLRYTPESVAAPGVSLAFVVGRRLIALFFLHPYPYDSRSSRRLRAF